MSRWIIFFAATIFGVWAYASGWYAEPFPFTKGLLAFLIYLIWEAKAFSPSR